MPNDGTKIPCALCGRMLPRPAMERFCGHWVCPHCLAEETFVCTCCGNRAARSEQVRGISAQVCQTCFDAHFTLCSICGNLLPQEAARWCFLEGQERPVCACRMAAVPPAAALPAFGGEEHRR